MSELSDLREQWGALATNPQEMFMMLPKEALVASVRDLANELLQRTRQVKGELGNYTVLGPECFTNGLVISYQGENYFKACEEFVFDLPDGGQSFCVKRVNHPGDIHEDYDGRTRKVEVWTETDQSKT